MTTKRLRIFALLSLGAILATACGDKGAVTTTTTGVPSGTTTTDGKADGGDDGSSGGGVSNLQDVRTATVKILSEGSFVDPEFGAFTAAGIGSGFIIDSSGIVVTNNHVVTGSALLRVYVDGQDDPVNARILGVSECSDLAVIDLEGDGYPFLEYSNKDLDAGLDVYAAGFPAEDLFTAEEFEGADYTLTNGIISSAEADGETNWASVDQVLEHDAKIRGGNSGGPLVDEDGRVVGVNYAGSDFLDINNAIGINDAESVIEQLQSEEDVDSIGVNGQAVFDENAGVSGIWVASVDTNSPAGETELDAGDIITSIEGLAMGADGTMSDYCDVLRSHSPDDKLRIEVLRYASSEVLEGELNGQPLEQSFSFANEFDEEAPAGTDSYSDFQTITDDTGAIQVSIPVEWTDINGAINENYGPSIFASPNIESFSTTWGTPGLVLEASSSFGPDDFNTVLDELAGVAGTADCVSDGGRTEYQDPLYVGLYEYFRDCGGTAAEAVLIAASPEDGSFVVRVFVQIVEGRDLDALDAILNSFAVIGQV